MIFLDSNILIYSVSKAPEEIRKAEKSRELLNRTDICLSIQVFQEFFVNATHKIRTPILSEDAVALIQTWCRFPVQNLTAEIMFSAFEIKEQFQLSYWDSAIISAAWSLKCEKLYSEDFQHGQKFGKLTVENPFLTP